MSWTNCYSLGRSSDFTTAYYLEESILPEGVVWPIPQMANSPNLLLNILLLWFPSLEMPFKSISYLIFKVTSSKQSLLPPFPPHLEPMAFSLLLLCGLLSASLTLLARMWLSAEFSEPLATVPIRREDTWGKQVCSLDLSPVVSCTAPHAHMFVAWTTFLIKLSWSLGEHWLSQMACVK